MVQPSEEEDYVDVKDKKGLRHLKGFNFKNLQKSKEIAKENLLIEIKFQSQ